MVFLKIESLFEGNEDLVRLSAFGVTNDPSLFVSSNVQSCLLICCGLKLRRVGLDHCILLLLQIPGPNQVFEV